MRCRTVIKTEAVICAFLFLTTFAPARSFADTACPVAIDDFRRSGIGTPHGFVQYQVGIHSNAPTPFALRLSVYEYSEGRQRTVYAPTITTADSVAGPQHATIVFPWSNTVRQVAAKEVIWPDGRIVECDTTSSRSLVATQDAILNLFDDSALELGPEVPGMPATDAIFVSRADPVYPPLDYDQWHQGTATVAVFIGPGGRLLGASVPRSSGFPLLDAAAYVAAMKSTYEAPVVNGKETILRFLVQYSFRIVASPQDER